MQLSLRHARRTCISFVLLLCAILSATAIPAPAAVVFGVYSRQLVQDTGLTLDRFASETGIMPQIAMYYRDWNPNWSTAMIDRRIVGPIVARKAVPMITWEPFIYEDAPGGQPAYAPRRIAAGMFDAYIQRAAREAAAFRHPFFLRLAHEMNGDRYPWGITPENSPAEYVAAWRHVVSIFRAAGARNVRWVWSPNVSGSSGEAPLAAYYPGDAWVDDVGLDGYNFGSASGTSWRTFKQVFYPSYKALGRLTSRPIFVTETGSSELGGDKAAWIAGIKVALSRDMPRVRALIWFDVSKEANWMLNSSPASLDAFRRLVRGGALSGRASRLTAPATSTGSSADGPHASRARATRE